MGGVIARWGVNREMGGPGLGARMGGLSGRILLHQYLYSFLCLLS